MPPPSADPDETAPEEATARVFWSGRSQAVRLPKAFRLDADAVRVRREGTRLVLEPVARDWSWLDAVTGPLDADFAAAAQEPRAHQDRPGLEDGFDSP